MSPKTPKKRLVALTAAALCLGIILLTQYPSWLGSAGLFLCPGDRLAKADCIVALRANDAPRLRQAAELLKQGYATHLVLSIIPPTKRLAGQAPAALTTLEQERDRRQVLNYLRDFGRNEEGVLFTDEVARSTFEEAVAAKKLMEEKNFRSLILVTDAYHMRRALILFTLLFRGTGIRIYHASVAPKGFDPRQWWRKKKELAYVRREYLSLAYNLFYHFLLNR